MPTPDKPITIGVKNTNLSTGEYIKVTNFTSGGVMKKAVNSSGEAKFTPSDEGLTWNQGDTILIESQGRIPFSQAATITKGGYTTTSSASTADTSSPSVSL